MEKVGKAGEVPPGLPGQLLAPPTRPQHLYSFFVSILVLQPLLKGDVVGKQATCVVIVLGARLFPEAEGLRRSPRSKVNPSEGAAPKFFVEVKCCREEYSGILRKYLTEYCKVHVRRTE